MMLLCTTCLIALAASCSGVLLQDDTLDLSLSPALYWSPVKQTEDSEAVQTSALGASREPPLNRPIHGLAAVAGEVQLPLADAGVLTQMGGLKPSAELEDTQSSPSSIRGTGDVLGVPVIQLTRTHGSDTGVQPAVAPGEPPSGDPPEFPRSAESAPPTKETDSSDPSAPAGAASSPLSAAGDEELRVPLEGASAVGHSRHRPEPGLAPSERRPSSRRDGVPPLEMLESQSKPRKGVLEPPQPMELVPSRSGAGHSTRKAGVPDLEMLENQSKPRKGVLEPGVTIPGQSSRRTGVPDLEMLENQSKPRKGVLDPPPDWELAAAISADPQAEEPTDESADTRQQAKQTNLAKARAAVIVGGVFGVLSVLVLVGYGVRRLTERWQHRHYRKMDFLVDGMYNM